MKKIMLIFGTRPEAIKLCPLIKELSSRKEIKAVVCVTGQHREMLDSVLTAFSVRPDYDLDIMKNGQTLFDVTEGVLTRLRPILEKEQPDVALVHGDTTTAFAAALACFYMKIPMGHVEAGLRTYDVYSPFPEEFNRRAISLVAKYNFAPSELAKANLLREGCSPSSLFVTGNTAIDALRTTVRENYNHKALKEAKGARIILTTLHRRESLGEPIKNVLCALRQAVDERSDVRVIYPLHKNPAVRKIANEILASHPRITLTEPLDVIDFHNLLARSYLVLTDSGGIQEEAPALGKPVLVARDKTERPEGVSAGTLALVGTNKKSVYEELCRLLDDKSAYDAMAKAVNPYGDGFASKRITDILLK